MAELSTTDRARVRRALARYWSKVRTTYDLDTSELRAAVDATDTWIDDNQSSYNSALPAAAQSNLTIAQKTLLFCAVALARVGIPTLRKLFGEVD
jgi:hypothetical protein